MRFNAERRNQSDLVPMLRVGTKKGKKTIEIKSLYNI
jgi:hypothetical protein